LLAGNSGTGSALPITPTPHQLDLPLWTRGIAGAEIAGTRGLSWVADAGNRVGAQQQWAAIEARLGPAARRLRRPALLDLSHVPDADANPNTVVQMLTEAQLAWDLDIAVLQLPNSDPADWTRHVRSFGSALRALPVGGHPSATARAASLAPEDRAPPLAE
jgi:hypothetical protein